MTTTLQFDPSHPPTAILAVVDAARLPVVFEHVSSSSWFDSVRVSTSSGVVFVGTPLVIRYFARLASSTVSSLTALLGDPHSPSASTSVDFFIALSALIVDKDTLAEHAALINEHLSTRTLLVGNDISVADLIIVQQLEFNTRWNSLKKSSQEQYPHLFRWFRFVHAAPLFSSSLRLIAALAEKRQKDFHEHSKGGSFDIGVNKGAPSSSSSSSSRQVITRFPPEPSGYLHIGHAKAALLNYHYAKEFNGELIVRFDDTNPSKEKDEYVESILADIARLGIKYSKLTYTSDYFDLLIDYCTRLINDGRAYVDDTPVELMRKERMDGISSKSRERTIEENIALWQEMQAGTEKGLTCVVRAKIDMQAANKTLRDPTLYRCNVKVPHHRTGVKYKVYPTYDFCCPVVDSIEDVTHVLRTIEYRDRNAQYAWMISALGLRQPIIKDYARLNFVYTLMSKRKLQWFVDQKLVEGWNDPRFPTIQGVIRRGMTVEAIQEFMHSQGFSININYMEWDKIWSINKSIIDKTAHRFTAIESSTRVPFTLVNVDAGVHYASVPLHPKDKTIGTKVVARSNVIYLEQDDARSLTAGEEVTLFSWGNAFVDEISVERSTDADGDSVRVVSCRGRLHTAGDVKKTEKKLTWVAGPAVDLVPAVAIEYDHIITVPKLEENQDVASVVRSPSQFTTSLIGEQALRSVQQGQIIQLNRRGFFRVDAIQHDNSPLKLVLIPDGRQKSMSTLSTKVDKAADKKAQQQQLAQSTNAQNEADDNEGEDD